MSSWQTNLNDFISSNINKHNILHLNNNSVLGLEKRLGLDSIIVSQKYDLVIIQESKIGVDIPDESFNPINCFEEIVFLVLVVYLCF